MMEQTLLVPRRRFREFQDTHDWEQRELSQLVDIRSGRDYKHLLEGDIPVYGTGGYMLSVNAALSYNEDAIGIGRKGTIDKPFILKAPFWTVDTLFYAIPKEKNDLNFIYAIFQEINWRQKDESTGVPSLSKVAINAAQVITPKYTEQKVIGDFFKYLDNLITRHQRKLDKTKALKSAYLSEMFPAEGENKPKRRFTGFTQPWDQRELDSIFKKIRNAFVGTATPYYVESGYFYLESNNVKDGKINRITEIFINDEFYEKQKDKLLHTGDLVMVQSGHVGHTAVIGEELDGTAAHALIMLQQYKEQVDPYFLNFQFQTREAKRKLENITTGNTIKHILASEIKKFEVSITDIEEQNLIGAFFKTLDDTITLHQRKLEKLQNIKKAYLNEMFV
jgi:type I restriction enzyme, S subunit